MAAVQWPPVTAVPGHVVPGRLNPQTKEKSLAQYKEQVVRLGGPNVVINDPRLTPLYRELAVGDLYFLLVQVLGRKDCRHQWVFERIREVEIARDGYLDLWARGHFKSSLITYAMTIQDILKNPEITVGIFSYNRPIAKAFLRQIKREFEANVELRRLFPDVIWDNPERDAPTWSEDGGIIVKRKGNPKEATVEAWGLVDAQPTSKHYGLMVYDDVVTAESVSTPDMINKVTTAWETSRNLGTEGGATRYVGTRWHFNDTYKAIIDRGAAKERRHPATSDGTMEGEPVLLSREALAEKRRDMGAYVFAAQLLLDPAGDRSQGFREKWITWTDTHSTGDGMNKYILVDPASAKKRTSDYTAIAVIGLSSDDNYYLLDAVRDRLSLRERGDAVFALHRRWKPKGVGYERYGMMGDIEYLYARMEEENYRFDVTELGGQISKPDRIRRMVPIFEAGRFLLPPSIFKVDYEGKRVDLVQSFLNDEYRAFPVGVHDDLFDAISRICDADLGIVWPKVRTMVEDRYAAPRRRTRGRQISWMAA